MSDGESRTVSAALGESLLQIAQKNGVNIEGACEGLMACSTCHVIVEEGWFDNLKPAGEEEEDLLDLANGLSVTSRLGCQISMTDELDGLVVKLPEETYNLLG